MSNKLTNYTGMEKIGAIIEGLDDPCFNDENAKGAVIDELIVEIARQLYVKGYIKIMDGSNPLNRSLIAYTHAIAEEEYVKFKNH